MHKKFRGPCRIAHDNYTVFKVKVNPSRPGEQFWKCSLGFKDHIYWGYVHQRI